MPDCSSHALRIANVEQYRTTRRVTGLPRTITIRVSGLGTAYIQGTDLAISRYNAENLQIGFQRETSGGNIVIQGFYEGLSGGFITLGSAGFPTSSGNPYPQILMNTRLQAYGSNPNVKYAGSVIQYEIGHCIGFKHTDNMNRAFSGGSGGTEGAHPMAPFISRAHLQGRMRHPGCRPAQTAATAPLTPMTGWR